MLHVSSSRKDPNLLVLVCMTHLFQHTPNEIDPCRTPQSCAISVRLISHTSSASASFCSTSAELKRAHNDCTLISRKTPFGWFSLICKFVLPALSASVVGNCEQDISEGQLAEFNEKALVPIGKGADRCLNCTGRCPTPRGHPHW